MRSNVTEWTKRRKKIRNDVRNESTETRCDGYSEIERERAKRSTSKGKFETEQIMNG